jgi:NAD(P)-dependent dehydrogenase (short-subunit alcohol dehydrogenase family)
MPLAGKTLFITGASRGIGLAIALRAARDGANIAIAAKTATPHPRLPGTIHTAAADIEAAGGRALPLEVDVRDESAVKDAIERTADHFGGIDIVVNNASAIALTKVADTDIRRFDLMHQVNTRGTFLVSKYAIPHLEKAVNPHILMLSPPLDMKEKWFAPHTAYTIAKFGMSMVVLGLSGDCGQCAVAAHHHRHGGDPESARRRGDHTPVAQPGHRGRGSLPDLRRAGELHGPLPHRRYVPRRAGNHRFRPLPGRPGCPAGARFLRSRRLPAAPGGAHRRPRTVTDPTAPGLTPRSIE